MVILRGHGWATYLAIKAIALSVVATGAAAALTKLALPRLVDALHGMGREPSAWVWMGLKYQDWLPVLPASSLLLGVAALMYRQFRPLLAVLAMLVAVGSTAVIVGMLIGTMAPLYDVPSRF